MSDVLDHEPSLRGDLIRQLDLMMDHMVSCRPCLQVIAGDHPKYDCPRRQTLVQRVAVAYSRLQFLSGTDTERMYARHALNRARAVKGLPPFAPIEADATATLPFQE